MSRGILLSFVTGSLGLAAPYISKLYFDRVYPARDVSLLHALVLASAAFAVTSALLGALRSYYTQVISSRLSNAVALMYVNHLQHLPMRFFEQRRVGEVMSRVSDMRGALGTVSRVFQTILVNGIYLVIVPPFLVLLNWHLALLSLVATPLTVGISTATSRVTRRYMKRSTEAAAELSAIQVESLSQIRTLKAMAAEPVVFGQLREQAEELLQLQLRASAISTSVGIANAVIRAASAGLFSWYAWTLMLDGTLSLGSFVAFSAYLGYLTGPVAQVASLFADFQQSAITLGRAFEYLDLETEQPTETVYDGWRPIRHQIHGHIVLDQVSFGYDTQREVLHDVSLYCRPGTVTAIVGTTGAGKSTILKLLCGMEQPTKGTITIDGVPLSSIELADLRRQVGVVWQDPTLFRGTIMENLTFGVEDVSFERVAEAVRICQLDRLIDELPDGYETLVAEWGSTVSGGQRQRFALARALVREAPVLLLDETTSQLDVRTEEEVLRAILPQVRDKTVVLVTHRLATAALADQICVMKHGCVVGAGGHADLLRRCDEYRELQAIGATNETRRMLALHAT